VEKKVTNGWDEKAICNVNIIDDKKSSYSFTLKVHKINTDKSGMIFGFSNNNDVTLGNANKNVGLSAAGKQ